MPTDTVEKPLPLEGQPNSQTAPRQRAARPAGCLPPKQKGLVVGSAQKPIPIPRRITREHGQLPQHLADKLAEQLLPHLPQSGRNLEGCPDVRGGKNGSRNFVNGHTLG